jgi:hypothetical protein
MFDLGRSFLASVERSPDAVAIVDGEQRLSYGDWYAEIRRVAEGLVGLGLKRGDRLAVILQNRLEMASLHWACQFLGIVMTPLNWRLKAGELDYCLADAEAGAVVFDRVAADTVAGTITARNLPRVTIGAAAGGSCRFDEWPDFRCALMPRAGPEDLSLLLYTSGTTGRPKGVPRRHRAERAAALAHVAQNLYGRYERTLGVMPLYHTMGIRSLLAMALVDGTFVCQPRFDTAAALRLIARERVTNLYLVPTLYHDLVSHPDFAAADTSSVRKVGFAGAGDARRPAEAGRGGIPAGAVRQSLRFDRDLHLHDRAGSGGEAGLGRQGRDQPAHPGGQARRQRPGRTRRGRRGGRGYRGHGRRRGVRGLLAPARCRCQSPAPRLVFHRGYRLCRCRGRPVRHRPGRLQKMVGVGRAKNMVMRSRRLGGRQAHEWGVATECVADSALEGATDALAEELRGFPPLAQRIAKKLLNDTEDATLSLAIELEGQAYSRLRSSDDFREGVEAFQAKRKPNYRGS